MNVVEWLANLAPAETMFAQPHWVRAYLAVTLVCVVCGLVGTLVVGNRLAYFSDALTHCAFAGVALGLLTRVLSGYSGPMSLDDPLIPVIMVLTGVMVGLGIAWVREHTALASDTVIGVFFAGAVGFGGALLTGLRGRNAFDPEKFLFGGPFFVTDADLIALTVLLAVMTLALVVGYNRFVLASFNPSLAGSRGVSLRVYQYLFIALLAVVVNLCLKAVGALLINAMLVVPAAAASNLSRNVRQMFWVTVVLSLVSGWLGLWLSKVTPTMPDGAPLELGPSGLIVLVSVAFFFASMALRPWVRGR